MLTAPPWGFDGRHAEGPPWQGKRTSRPGARGLRNAGLAHSLPHPQKVQKVACLIGQLVNFTPSLTQATTPAGMQSTCPGRGPSPQCPLGGEGTGLESGVQGLSPVLPLGSISRALGYTPRDGAGSPGSCPDVELSPLGGLSFLTCTMGW